MIVTTGAGASARVRFTDTDGAVYTVWDTVFASGRHRRFLPPRGTASARVFVPAHGPKRLDRFARGVDRACTAEALAAQLRHAEYLPTSAFDAAAHTHQ